MYNLFVLSLIIKFRILFFIILD